MSNRIVVAMSGGVDSSVAAALLHEEGHEVIGITMQLWGKDVCTSAGTRLCCSVRDALDAKAVAKRLGIRHEVLELAEEFRTHVIDYFVDSYREGLTPNPCIACNTHIKFGALFERADELGASAIASGHYARAGYDVACSRHVLRQADDPSKDQSYVLFTLTQPQLARARFPLGTLTKSQVREMARSLGLATAEKPDSQDVCFVRDRDKDGFLRRELSVAEEPGPITDTQGNLLGAHQGLLGYTIGQREGLGIAIGKPLYVVAVDRPNNRLVVGSRQELLCKMLIAERVNWVSIEPPAGPRSAQVKIRSRHEPAAAILTPLTDHQVRVEFEEPQSAVTPGQAAVFYDGGMVLGGGWIVKDG
jgi:tRNA-specific 2-thiouridylase